MQEAEFFFAVMKQMDEVAATWRCSEDLYQVHSKKKTQIWTKFKFGLVSRQIATLYQEINDSYSQ